MINRNSFIFVVISIALCACHHNPEKVLIKKYKNVLHPADSTYMVIEPRDHNQVYQTIRPATLERCALYTTPDTLSTVKMMVPAFTSFKFLSHIDVMHDDTLNDIPNNPPYVRSSLLVYYKIQLITGGVEGYILNNKVASFTFNDAALRFCYMVGEYVDARSRDLKVRFVKYDITAKKIVSSLEHLGYPEGILEVNEVKNLPLSNVSFCLHLTAHNDYCGGGQSELLMVDTPNGMTFLPHSFTSFDDGGGRDVTTVYIPAVNGKGKLFLYADADTRHAATTAYPANAKFPLKDIIVKKSEEGQAYLNNDGQPIILKNGEEKMESLSRTTAYYHWDGKITKQVYKKTIKIK